MSHIRPALVLTLLFTLLTGLATRSPLPDWPGGPAGTGQRLAGSSRWRRGRLQPDRPELRFAALLPGPPFRNQRTDPADASRTVEAPYNAANSTGSNLGPSSKALLDAVTARAAALGSGPQPADLLTASASGLDPHISPAGAMAQVARVAEARGLPEAQLRDLVERQIEGRELGVLGEARVNVLRLNIALDALKP